MIFPPGDGAEVARWVVQSPLELREMRASLRAIVPAILSAPGPASPSLSASMEVAATELATNALVHSRPPAIVQLRRHADQFVLDVADHHPSRVPYFADARAPGDGGLGLRLVRDTAAHVGYYVAAGQKHVWAGFPASG
jgi:hypothetical protein